jgi:zinc transporter ZupT
MIVNWMSLPTAIGQIVGWFASLFGGSQQLFINIFRGIGAALLLWIAVRPVVGGARRRPGRDPARGHRAARHRRSSRPPRSRGT